MNDDKEDWCVFENCFFVRCASHFAGGLTPMRGGVVGYADRIGARLHKVGREDGGNESSNTLYDERGGTMKPGRKHLES